LHWASQFTFSGEITMAISTGKSARKRLGTRAAAKRQNRHTNPEKKARWAAMERDRKNKKSVYAA
jgi:hypothetical protein